MYGSKERCVLSLLCWSKQTISRVHTDVNLLGSVQPYNRSRKGLPGDLVMLFHINLKKIMAVAFLGLKFVENSIETIRRAKEIIKK